MISVNVREFIIRKRCDVFSGLEDPIGESYLICHTCKDEEKALK